MACRCDDRTPSETPSFNLRGAAVVRCKPVVASSPLCSVKVRRKARASTWFGADEPPTGSCPCLLCVPVSHEALELEAVAQPEDQNSASYWNGLYRRNLHRYSSGLYEKSLRIIARTATSRAYSAPISPPPASFSWPSKLSDAHMALARGRRDGWRASPTIRSKCPLTLLTCLDKASNPELACANESRRQTQSDGPLWPALDQCGSGRASN